MKEATASHNLRGLSLIGDLYILMGIGMIPGGVYFLLMMNLGGLVFLGMGLLLVSIGHYLDDLNPWAWWGAVLGNFGSGGTIAFTIAGSSLQIAISLFYYLAQAAFTIAIFVYLLRPSVRELFFPRENM
ncbi:MAG: hypothetical protein RTU63_09655 [Candidatus Thorarchaeota archaeon]